MCLEAHDSSCSAAHHREAGFCECRHAKCPCQNVSAAPSYSWHGMALCVSNTMCSCMVTCIQSVVAPLRQSELTHALWSLCSLRRCCFTCPNQPVCAVCTSPCNPEVQSVEVIVGTLPTTPERYTCTQLCRWHPCFNLASTIRNPAYWLILRLMVHVRPHCAV
jgi:hypothetical protein